MSFSKAINSAAVRSIGCLEVAKLQLLHLGHIRSMDVSVTREFEVVQLAKERVSAEGHMPSMIHMQYSPCPL